MVAEREELDIFEILILEMEDIEDTLSPDQSEEWNAAIKECKYIVNYG